MEYALILFFIADAIIELWEEFNAYTIKQITAGIAKSEAKMDTDGWRSYLAVQSALLTKEIKKKLTRTLTKSNTAIIDAFNEIIEKTQTMNEGYELTETEALKKRLELLYKQTAGEIKNLTGSMAREATGIFMSACDRAVILSQSGLMSRSEAIIKAIDETAQTGLYVKYPSGHKDRTEVAVRRAVQTGCAQASGAGTTEICRQNGCNYVCVSSHLGARVSVDPIADHSGWQGKVYKIREDGEHKEIPLLYEATGYDAENPDMSDPLGLYGYNCRHSMIPVPDIELFKNNQPQFDSEENKRVYEATQKQRAMERAMRDTRREIEAAKAARDNVTTEETRRAAEDNLRTLNNKFKAQQDAYTEFCRREGLPEQRDRLAI